MVLETVGRRSGERRFVPVGYWRQGDVYVVCGSAAGMSTVPDWVRNLRCDPRAAVWIRRSRTRVVAQELTGADRASAERRATEIWPRVPRYEARSGRVASYFRLVPMPDEHPLPEGEVGCC